MKKRCRRLIIGLIVLWTVLSILIFTPESAVASVESSSSASETRWTPQMSPLVQISDDASDSSYPDVAYNSQADEYLVVWRADNSIVGRRVSSRGEPIGSQFTIEPDATSTPWPPKVAYDSTQNWYLVIWGHNTGNPTSDLRGRFIPSNGPNPAYTTFQIDANKPTETYGYALAYGLVPNEFMVVWTYTPSGEKSKIAGRRVNADGTGFAAGSFVIAADSTDYRQDPDIAYNLARNEYLVTYDDSPKVDDNVWGTRMTGTGVILGGGEFLIAGWPDEEADVAVAACASADQYLVGWHSIQTPGDGMYARYVAGDGTTGTVNLLAQYSTWESYRPLDIACGVTGLTMEDPRYLAVWAEDPSSNQEIYAREVKTDGTMSDPVEIVVGGKRASVAGGKINFLVAFEIVDIYVRIVGNTKPQASFFVTPTDAVSTTDFIFDATASSDATDPQSQLQFRWDWDADGVYDTTWDTHTMTTHKYTIEDWQGLVVFTARLQVTDGHGVADTTTQQVTVRNAPPTASFSVTPGSGNQSTVFSFNAQSSSDPENGTLQVRWDWQADGTYDTGWSSNLTTSHIYTNPGTYTIRLQVKDSFDQTAQTTHQVTVAAGGKGGYLQYLPMVLE